MSIKTNKFGEKFIFKENTKQKIKAIYPHIVVGGDIDKPCYTIHWYDIEQKTMICGFGSYKLELVRKWLEEEFEVVEEDIDNLIKSQEAEIEKLNYIITNYIIGRDNHCISVLYDLYDKYDKAVEENKELNAKIKRYEDLKKAENILVFFEQNAFKRSIYNTIDTIKQLENEIEELRKMVGN